MFAGVLREHLDFNLSSNLVNSAIGNSLFVNEANRSRSTIVSRLSDCGIAVDSIPKAWLFYNAWRKTCAYKNK